MDIFRNRWSSRSNGTKINGTRQNKINGTQRCLKHGTRTKKREPKTKNINLIYLVKCYLTDDHRLLFLEKNLIRPGLDQSRLTTHVAPDLKAKPQFPSSSNTDREPRIPFSRRQFPKSNLQLFYLSSSMISAGNHARKLRGDQQNV
jgi:hypothetical protein